MCKITELLGVHHSKLLRYSLLLGLCYFARHIFQYESKI